MADEESLIPLEILGRVLDRIPYPHQVEGIDLFTERGALRFRWRRALFRVSGSLMVEEIVMNGHGFLGSPSAILLEAILKGECPRCGDDSTSTTTGSSGS